MNTFYRTDLSVCFHAEINLCQWKHVKKWCKFDNPKFCFCFVWAWAILSSIDHLYSLWGVYRRMVFFRSTVYQDWQPCFRSSWTDSLWKTSIQILLIPVEVNLTISIHWINGWWYKITLSSIVNTFFMSDSRNNYLKLRRNYNYFGESKF